MSLRRASTVCVVRDSGGIEVLMVRRPLTARFMPGAWVFPGGAVDDADIAAPPSFGPPGDAHDWKVAALRELIEETGLWVTTDGVVSTDLPDNVFAAVEESPYRLDPEALIYFANWVTPSVFPIRFDTRFFLTVADGETTATIDGHELVDHAWISPQEALNREASREWEVAFPTCRTLEVLDLESSAPALADRLSSLALVPPIEPRLWVGEGEAKILLPDDPGFDDVEEDQRDPALLERLAEVVALDGIVPAELRSRP